MDPQLPQIQTAGILPPQQVRHDQRRRYALGDGAGQCHTVRRHVQADDEEQVQRHVQRTGDGQIQQGALGVACGAHHAVAAVVDGHGGHTEGEDLQVQHRAVHQLLLGVQHLQHLVGKQVAGQTHHDTEDGTDDECRVDGFFRLLLAADTQRTSHRHIDAGAHADEESGEQRHQRGRGAHGAQRLIAGKLTHHRHVAQVEQHLQQLRQHQRQAEQQDVLPEGTGGHLDLLHSVPPNFRISISIYKYIPFS